MHQKWPINLRLLLFLARHQPQQNVGLSIVPSSPNHRNVCHGFSSFSTSRYVTSWSYLGLQYHSDYIALEVKLHLVLERSCQLHNDLTSLLYRELYKVQPGQLYLCRLRVHLVFDHPAQPTHCYPTSPRAPSWTSFIRRHKNGAIVFLPRLESMYHPRSSRHAPEHQLYPSTSISTLISSQLDSKTTTSLRPSPMTISSPPMP